MIDFCSWDNPGHDPYTGKPEAAIMAFTDIPLSIRKTLIERAEQNEYSDLVQINKAGIVGRNDYGPDLKDMHFGSSGKQCHTVSRAKWRDTDAERAMVFCEEGYCVARPSVCNNWSRIESRSKASGIDLSTLRSEFVPYGEYGYVYPPSMSIAIDEADQLHIPVVTEAPQGSTVMFGGSSIVFASFGSPGGGCAVCAVPTVPDCPPLPAVPEPSAWALILAGLAVVWRKVRNKNE